MMNPMERSREKPVISGGSFDFILSEIHRSKRILPRDDGCHEED
jgi:hypothetical protein